MEVTTCIATTSAASGKDLRRKLRTDRCHAIPRENRGLEKGEEYSMETATPGRSAPLGEVQYRR
jgi:hypothetical protein